MTSLSVVKEGVVWLAEVFFFCRDRVDRLRELQCVGAERAVVRERGVVRGLRFLMFAFALVEGAEVGGELRFERLWVTESLRGGGRELGGLVSLRGVTELHALDEGEPDPRLRGGERVTSGLRGDERRLQLLLRCWVVAQLGGEEAGLHHHLGFERTVTCSRGGGLERGHGGGRFLELTRHAKGAGRGE